jgi:hypothetical protein
MLFTAPKLAAVWNGKNKFLMLGLCQGKFGQAKNILIFQGMTGGFFSVRTTRRISMSELPDEKDFFELLASTAREDRGGLIGSIIQNAKLGDASSLKILERALLEGRFGQEEKLKLTDGQYKTIILLAADRIRGGKITQTT